MAAVLYPTHGQLSTADGWRFAEVKSMGERNDLRKTDLQRAKAAAASDLDSREQREPSLSDPRRPGLAPPAAAQRVASPVSVPVSIADGPPARCQSHAAAALAQASAHCADSQEPKLHVQTNDLSLAENKALPTLTTQLLQGIGTAFSCRQVSDVLGMFSKRMWRTTLLTAQAKIRKSTKKSARNSMPSGLVEPSLLSWT